MKLILLILPVLFFTKCNGQEKKQTFKEVLNKNIENKLYKTNGLPYINTQTKDNSYLVFWHQKDVNYFLVFAENDKVFYVLNCNNIPIGTENLGRIKELESVSFKDLRNRLSFHYVNENSKDLYYEKATSFKETDASASKIFKGKLSENSLIIEVELEIPVIFYKLDKELLIAPFEY